MVSANGALLGQPTRGTGFGDGEGSELMIDDILGEVLASADELGDNSSGNDTHTQVCLRVYVENRPSIKPHLNPISASRYSITTQDGWLEQSSVQPTPAASASGNLSGGIVVAPFARPTPLLAQYPNLRPLDVVRKTVGRLPSPHLRDCGGRGVGEELGLCVTVEEGCSVLEEIDAECPRDDAPEDEDVTKDVDSVGVRVTDDD
ncbi:hypothetical protein NX059_010583 [Plenodomus lindquistii]|nr:hypothetical protein NX059_010583 [Plenodomus lindquistii]